jgi:hypothetical protein
MFAVLHLDINSLKPGLLQLTSQLKKRGAKWVDHLKSKMALETKFLGPISLLDTLALS